MVYLLNRFPLYITIFELAWLQKLIAIPEGCNIDIYLLKKASAVLFRVACGLP
jgi:hypothetical protein